MAFPIFSIDALSESLPSGWVFGENNPGGFPMISSLDLPPYILKAASFASTNTPSVMISMA